MSHRITNKNNVIGENSTFEGTIQLQGELRIDGTFLGNDLNTEHITVGKLGRVKSNITASSIVIEGTVLGNIVAHVRTMLLPTAKILGDITSPELIIQNGVMWDGHCHISTNPSANIANEIHKLFE